MNPSIFHEHKIVGVFDRQFSHEDAWKIGNAAGRFLPSLVRGYDRGRANTQCICVAHDMREHSPGLAAHLIEGIRCAGVNVIDIGMVDTPQLYFAINHLGTCGGIQITASDRSSPYNGLKIAGQHAIPIGIDTGLMDIRHLALSLLHTKGIASGSVRKLDLLAEYKHHVLSFVRSPLKPFKLAIDASNGMAGKLIPLIFDGLGLDIREINFRHDGRFKHTPDPLIQENLLELGQTIKAARCDFGFCFDGDADRVVVMDEHAHCIPSDFITAFLAAYFLKRKPRATIVYDQRSSRVVPEEITKNEGTPRRGRVGHCHMQKAMRDCHAIFGGEMSGHFYFGDHFFSDSGMMTLVHILNAVSQADKPISALISPLRRYYQTGEISFQVEDKQAALRELTECFAEGKVNCLDGITIDFNDWWFHCRPSRTEPLLRVNIEARNRGLLEKKRAVIERQMGAPV